MAGALTAPLRVRRSPDSFRVHLHMIWSFSWTDPDPAPSESAAMSSSPASSSSSKAQQKNLSHRLATVADAIRERKLPPELRGLGNAIRSETDIVNVVEQRIWHSMEQGDFENLPGKGRPLNLDSNPHVDPAEDTLYRILSRNGFAPEWVELNKEIHSSIAEWRTSLKKAWARKSDHEQLKWQEDSEILKAQMGDINRKILRYNLIVPFGRQMFGLKWEKEISTLE
ncbi:dnaJ homolog subfamily C member 28-like [Zingiber officinale]|nr:dnaJ homolog subfamily C member 28-like [Zingiber officinale]